MEGVFRVVEGRWRMGLAVGWERMRGLVLVVVGQAGGAGLQVASAYNTVNAMNNGQVMYVELKPTIVNNPRPSQNSKSPNLTRLQK